MKPQTLLTLILVLAAAPGFAIDPVYLEPVQPVSPVLKAQGGTSTSNAEGFDALFANPAAFTNPKASITFLSLESTGHIPLSGIRTLADERESWSQFANLLSGSNPLLGTLNDMIAATGLGAEGSLRAGWVGNNLGVGMAVEGRLMSTGSDLLSAAVAFDQTTVGVIGMAWPFDVGVGTLNIGGALRPMQRSLANLSFTDVKSNGLNVTSYTILSGFGLAWDLGLRWDYAQFKTGLTVRDIGSTTINFKSYTVSDWTKGLTVPSGGAAVSQLYTIPTVIGLGSTWTPDMGSMASLVQPAVSLDFQVPIKGQYTQPSFWTWTHLGAEARLLQFLAVRTGLNQGYFTFGLGAKLFLVDFNLAVFSDEMGLNSGLQRRPGISMEWAVRL